MWFLVPWHRAQPSPVRPTLQCFRRHRCPAAVAADSVARPVRTTTVGYPAAVCLLHGRFGFWKSGGDFFGKDMGNTPKRKVCWLNSTWAQLHCYMLRNYYATKNTLMPGFFFQVCFWRFCFPQSMVFPGSKCYAEKQKKEEHGMGFKALVGYCCLSLATPGCFKNESTLWGFVSYHKWASFCKQAANKNHQKPKLWLQMMDLWEAKEGVQYNGSHPTTSKVYTDLRGFTDISKIR